ncbi:HNH endonuclease, partial [candidate division KSB1 bacterium]|nr:HNH endonuclease [candidate division KSB1 bacterium]
MISAKEWQEVLRKFKWRCAYCQVPAIYLPRGLEKEHILPRSAGGSDTAKNICPACSNCSGHKADKVFSIDPQSGKKNSAIQSSKTALARAFRLGANRCEDSGSHTDRPRDCCCPENEPARDHIVADDHRTIRRLSPERFISSKLLGALLSRFPQIDLAQVKTYPVQQRHSKVHREEIAQPFRRGEFFETFFHSLPNILAAKDLRELVQHILNAKENGKPIIVMMGAHVIKVGLSPVLIDLMHKGFITCLAMNGAGVVHDSELALLGQTSEEV